MDVVKGGFEEHRQVPPDIVGKAEAAGEMREFEASRENLHEVLAFIDSCLMEAGFAAKNRTKILMACEEIYVNIADYAYAPDKGTAHIYVEIKENSGVEITFSDSGVPFDPLAREDPDVTLPAEKRRIGGLGIFMAKRLMDDVSYEFKDGRNIFRMTKKL